MKLKDKVINFRDNLKDYHNSLLYRILLAFQSCHSLFNIMQVPYVCLVLFFFYGSFSAIVLNFIPLIIQVFFYKANMKIRVIEAVKPSLTHIHKEGDIGKVLIGKLFKENTVGLIRWSLVYSPQEKLNIKPSWGIGEFKVKNQVKEYK